MSAGTRTVSVKRPRGWSVRSVTPPAPIVTTGAPFPGFDLVPETRAGATVLVARDAQQEYVFARLAR